MVKTPHPGIFHDIAETGLPRPGSKAIRGPMQRFLVAPLAAVLAGPAAAISTHDWIDRPEAPVQVISVEVGFHPLAAPAGEAVGLAEPLATAIRAGLARWGTAAGSPVRARVTIEGLKWANAGVAIVGGTSDELGGLVELLDPATGARLGRFYVDVFLSRAGLIGMAVRGDARATLARDFAEEFARAITGRKRP